MVNAAKVNGGSSCPAQAAFCVFFRVLGRFLRFQNPFKYNRNLPVNHETVHSARGCGRRRFMFILRYQSHGEPLTFPEEFLSILLVIRGNGVGGEDFTGNGQNRLNDLKARRGPACKLAVSIGG